MKKILILLFLIFLTSTSSWAQGLGLEFGKIAVRVTLKNNKFKVKTTVDPVYNYTASSVKISFVTGIRHSPFVSGEFSFNKVLGNRDLPTLHSGYYFEKFSYAKLNNTFKGKHYLYTIAYDADNGNVLGIADLGKRNFGALLRKALK